MLFTFVYVYLCYFFCDISSSSSSSSSSQPKHELTLFVPVFLKVFKHPPVFSQPKTPKLQDFGREVAEGRSAYLRAVRCGNKNRWRASLLDPFCGGIVIQHSKLRLDNMFIHCSIKCLIHPSNPKRNQVVLPPGRPDYGRQIAKVELPPSNVFGWQGSSENPWVNLGKSAA